MRPHNANQISRLALSIQTSQPDVDGSRAPDLITSKLLKCTSISMIKAFMSQGSITLPQSYGRSDRNQERTHRKAEDSTAQSSSAFKMIAHRPPRFYLVHPISAPVSTRTTTHRDAACWRRGKK